jgi:hypothetical protein
MIVIVPIRPNVVLGPVYFCPQIEVSVFIFGKIWHIPAKISLFMMFQRDICKEKTGREIYQRDSRLLALRADRRLVKKRVTFKTIKIGQISVSYSHSPNAHNYIYKKGSDDRYLGESP